MVLQHVNTYLLHVGSSSLTRVQTWAPSTGSSESQPLNHQGSPNAVIIFIFKSRVFCHFLWANRHGQGLGRADSIRFCAWTHLSPFFSPSFLWDGQVQKTLFLCQQMYPSSTPPPSYKGNVAEIRVADFVLLFPSLLWSGTKATVSPSRAVYRSSLSMHPWIDSEVVSLSGYCTSCCSEYGGATLWLTLF